MSTIRSLIITIITLFLVTGVAHADPALVRISDEDTTLYVLGTFHLLPPEAEWRTGAVDAALIQADAIYMEADVWSGGDQMMAGLVQAYGLNPAGTALSTMMSAKDWEAVSSYSTEIGIPPSGLEPMRPWLAAVTFGAVSAMVQGYDPNSGVDQQLFHEAKAEGRELRFFETAEQQIQFFAGMPDDLQTMMLVETARQGPEFAEQIQQLLEAWLAGDLERLNEVANVPMQTEAPELYEVLITNRNQNWVAELSELMDSSGVYFVAVGAAHLPGDEGIIELMRTRGFEVDID